MKDELADLVKRRHPLYECMAAHWNFVEATYEGGREWFAANIFKYLKEGEIEYAARVVRAYRFNHTKQVVDLLDKYLFKSPIERKIDDAPPSVQNFWKVATRSGMDIGMFAKRISTATSQFGRVWIVVDAMSAPADISVAEAKALGIRTYAYIIKPIDMLDMSYDDQGVMRWALVREIGRDDADPFESSGGFVNRYRLWTRGDWTLYEERLFKGKTRIVEVDYGVHDLGVVPIVNADHNFSEELYSTPGLIDDIAYLDRSVANYLSNLDAIIQDQTFSQLAMPAQATMPGEEGFDKLMEMGTKRVFLYNAEGGGKPEYLSPDPRQAGMIVTVIGKIMNEIYHSVGLAAARTKDDNGGGVDNASGVAKAYDFDGINAILASKADSMETTEKKIAHLVALWNGEEAELETAGELIAYSRDFDTRSLYDEFEIGAQLNLLVAPDELRRAQMGLVIKKLFPMATKAEEQALMDSLKKWPPPPIVATGVGGGGAPDPAKAAIRNAGVQKTAKAMTA